MNKIVFTFIVSLMIVPFASEAQVSRYLKKKVEKSVTKRADKEVDKAVDKAVNKSIDKILNGMSEDMEEAADSINGANDAEPGAEGENRDSEKRFEAAYGNLMKSVGVGIDVPHKDVYTFGSYMNMIVEVTNEDGSKTDPMNYNTYFSHDNADYGMEYKNEDGTKTSFLFDTDNNCTLILMHSESGKTGIATAMSPEQMKDMENSAKTSVEENEMPEGYNLKPTGRTRMISGYKCDEYRAEDDESEITLWVSDDLTKKVNANVYRNQMFGGRFWLAGKTDGVVIQYNSKSKLSEEQTLMTVQDIDFNKNYSISTEGYTLTGISMRNKQNVEE